MQGLGRERVKTSLVGKIRSVGKREHAVCGDHIHTKREHAVRAKREHARKREHAVRGTQLPMAPSMTTG